MTIPHHLRPIEPAEAVEALCDRLAADIHVASFGVGLELRAFRETRTPHDGRRLINALRHVLGRADLANLVEALLVEHHAFGLKPAAPDDTG